MSDSGTEWGGRSVLNLAAIHEAIAAAIPERECIVTARKRSTWAQVNDRTRRLGSYLRSRGLGCRQERAALRNWQSGQDHVALYLYNGHEYLEGMLGAYKARCAPFNVNYRHVENELAQLLGDADARAVVYHASFAPVLHTVRERLPKLEVLLQVDDGSGEPLLSGAVDYEQALACAEAAPPPDDLSADDLYILYTGGTTGLPKGVLWRQEDIFRAALATGWFPRSVEDVVERASRQKPVRSLPAPPFMHGAAHWVVFNMWHVGGTVLVQSNVRQLDADDIWSTAERERATHLLIVGDAFARPLIDQLDEKSYDLGSLKRVSSGGTIFSGHLKRALLERLPQIRILDTLGSSESGAQASIASSRGEGLEDAGFEVAEDNVLLDANRSALVARESDQVGWLAKRGHVPLGYHGDEEKTAQTFPVIDGVRYAVPGDRCAWGREGRLQLLGRDSVTINSGGEKIFAEEVEQALKQHPAVYDVVVVGTPSERWGQQVTAVLSLRDGERPTHEALRETASQWITGYKLPKSFVFVDRVLRAPSGKADYQWARQTASAALEESG